MVSLAVSVQLSPEVVVRVLSDVGAAVGVLMAPGSSEGRAD
jgi:hypothetical protein